MIRRVNWISSLALGRIVALGFGWLCLFGTVQSASAQRSVRDEARRAMATRAELEDMAKSGEQVGASRSVGDGVRRQKMAEAQAIQGRLTSGDFVAGDRISIEVLGAQPFRDTVTVEQGQTISLPNMGRISLRGVLRSELETHLRREVGRFLRDVTVNAGSVTRVAMLGSVGRPGFYQMSSDAMLSSAIMTSGGPVADSDLRQVVIRRGDDELWDRKSVQVALQEGVTLQELGLRGGDEIFVGKVRRLGPQAIQYFQIALQIVSTAVIISRTVK